MVNVFRSCEQFEMAITLVFIKYVVTVCVLIIVIVLHVVSEILILHFFIAQTIILHLMLYTIGQFSSPLVTPHLIQF